MLTLLTLLTLWLNFLCDPVLCLMHLWTKFATFEEFFSYQFLSSVTVWHTWKFKEFLLAHKRSVRRPNIFFVILWICTWVGKIVFSPFSKHLKLDFSISHSDERSRSEEISPAVNVDSLMARFQGSFPQCFEKSDGSQDKCRGSPDIPN